VDLASDDKIPLNYPSRPPDVQLAHRVAVAGGMFTPVRERRGELMGITTLAPYSQQGLGTGLTAELVLAGVAGGAETVFLTTDDAVALRSFQRVGFREV